MSRLNTKENNNSNENEFVPTSRHWLNKTTSNGVLGNGSACLDFSYKVKVEADLRELYNDYNVIFSTTEIMVGYETLNWFYVAVDGSYNIVWDYWTDATKIWVLGSKKGNIPASTGKQTIGDRNTITNQTEFKSWIGSIGGKKTNFDLFLLIIIGLLLAFIIIGKK